MPRHTISDAKEAGDRYCTLAATGASGAGFVVYDVRTGELLDRKDTRGEADAIADRRELAHKFQTMPRETALKCAQDLLTGRLPPVTLETVRSQLPAGWRLSTRTDLSDFQTRRAGLLASAYQKHSRTNQEM